MAGNAQADIGNMQVGAQAQATGWESVPGFNQDDLSQALPAMQNNCKIIGKTRVWADFCNQLNNIAPSSAALKSLLQNSLQPYQLNDGGKADGTITGYYEPIIECSRQKGGAYQHAIYAPPKAYYNIASDGGVSRKGVPIPTRSELLQNGSLNGNELMYCENAVELYFMQVQGSGSVRLPDGKIVRLAYAANNTHPSKPVAKWLADKGIMPLAQTSKDNIKAWAAQNPALAEEMLNSNPRFVFFREIPIVGNQGSPGTLGVPLTPLRSVAVDTNKVPMGTLLFLDTQDPDGKPMQRLVAAQDTGAAIKGAVRADYYWGFDAMAAKMAHRMKRPGRIWLLWPKSAGAPQS